MHIQSKSIFSHDVAASAGAVQNLFLLLVMNNGNICETENQFTLQAVISVYSHRKINRFKRNEPIRCYPNARVRPSGPIVYPILS